MRSALMAMSRCSTRDGLASAVRLKHKNRMSCARSLCMMFPFAPNVGAQSAGGNQYSVNGRHDSVNGGTNVVDGVKLMFPVRQKLIGVLTYIAAWLPALALWLAF